MNKFSKREQEIIKIIGRKKMTYADIGLKFFGIEVAPFNENIIIGNSIRTIIKKCEHYKLSFTLHKERSNGKLYIRRVKQ